MARFYQFTNYDGKPIKLRLAAVISWAPETNQWHEHVKTLLTIKGISGPISVQEDYAYVSHVMSESND